MEDAVQMPDRLRGKASGLPATAAAPGQRIDIVPLQHKRPEAVEPDPSEGRDEMQPHKLRVTFSRFPCSHPVHVANPQGTHQEERARRP